MSRSYIAEIEALRRELIKSIFAAYKTQAEPFSKRALARLVGVSEKAVRGIDEPATWNPDDDTLAKCEKWLPPGFGYNPAPPRFTTLPLWMAGRYKRAAMALAFWEEWAGANDDELLTALGESGLAPWSRIATVPKNGGPLDTWHVGDQLPIFKHKGGRTPSVYSFDSIMTDLNRAIHTRYHDVADQEAPLLQLCKMGRNRESWRHVTLLAPYGRRDRRKVMATIELLDD